MPAQIKKWGSVAILITLFSGIAVTGINNYVTWAAKQLSAVAPVVVAVDELKAVIIENQRINRKMFLDSQIAQRKDRKDNSDQHAELSVMVYEQGSQFKAYEAKLHRVMDDCTDNHDSILKCQRFHDRRIYEIPFDLLKEKDK